MQILAPIGFPSSPAVSTLRQWSVLQILDDEGQSVDLAVGLLGASGTRVRITSAIERFEGAQILTASGSIYTLAGPRATAAEVEEQATHRRALLGGRAAVDVTERYATRSLETPRTSG